MIGEYRHAIGTFSNHQDAELALHKLKDSGFEMSKISIIANDVNSHSDLAGAKQGNQLSDVDNKADEGATKGLISGSTVGGLTGLLVGLGLVAIPGVGPVVMAGAAATAIATTLTGSAIGAVTGGVFGGLIGLGIPKDRARIFSDRVAQGDYLAMVDDVTDEEFRLAESIFRKHGIHEWSIYESSRTRTSVTTN